MYFLKKIYWFDELNKLNPKKEKKKKHGIYILILRVYKELNGISK